MKKQKGVTLLIVLVVVALCVLIAAQLIEHGTFSERRTSLMLGREQAYQLALGGEALAAQWLTQGFDTVDVVHLNQPWATTPFEFPIEGGMIKASVRDAQTCFNINSILSTNSGRGNEPSTGDNSRNDSRNLTPQQDRVNAPRDDGSNQNTNQNPNRGIYISLLSEVSKELEDIEMQPSALADALIDWVDDNDTPVSPDGAESDIYTGYDVPYQTPNSLLGNKSELRVIQGYNAKLYKALKDHVCVLPKSDINKININTLTEEQLPLLKAYLGNNATTEQASEIIANRPAEEGYANVNEALQGLTSGTAGGNNNTNNNVQNRLDVTSKYFVVNIEVQYRSAVFRMRSLMERSEAKDQPFKVLTRYFGEF